MYQVLEHDSGITYRIEDPQETMGAAVDIIKRDAERYEREQKRTLTWNKNGQGFKASGPGNIRMWIRKV